MPAAQGRPGLERYRNLRSGVAGLARRALERLPIGAQEVPAELPASNPEPQERFVYRTLNFALHAGGVMLSSGAGTVEVEATILEVARSCGLARCEVDVTFTSMTASYLRGDEVEPITALQVVRRRTVDYSRLAAVHTLRADLSSGRIAPREGIARLEEIMASGSRRHPLVILGWAGMAAAFTVLLGGGPLVAAVAFVSTTTVYSTNRVLARRGIPDFFLSAFGAAVATAFAMALTALGTPVRSSLVVAGGIMVLVPGYALVASVQDALTGFPISGTARGLEVLLTATGILTGVAATLYLSRTLGLTLQLPLAPLSPIYRVPAQVAAAGVATALYAGATSVPRRHLLIAGSVGASGWACLLFLLHAGASLTVSTSFSAVLVGLVSNVLADRRQTHPFLFVVPGIMPLVPGFTIYQGMLAMFTGGGSGPATLLRALGLGLAIAAGVTLGNILVRPLRRPAAPAGPAPGEGSPPAG